jgi:D-3-phosphoglycerate dehydrogenase / 2-oxoglutarate reductase
MSTLQIVLTDTGFPDTKVEESILAPLKANLTVGRCRTEDDVLAITKEADAIMVQWAPITRRVMEQAKRCRIISRYGVGIDMIDQEAARDHKIRVANVPDFCVEEVATHTLGFLVTLSRKILIQDRLLRQGKWSMVDAIKPVNRFRGQTLGLIAVGKIARRFAEMAAPLGVRILGYDVNPPKDGGVVKFTDFDTVIRESDYLSLHCPLTKETQHLINAEVLGKMKPGSFLINMARGGVVDTEALLKALTSGHLAGAALDVFEQEPLPADHPLTKLENVILTPHLASYSLDAAHQLRESTARNIVEFFQKA